MSTVYLAAPLFSLAEQEFNQTLAYRLVEACPGLEVVLPQARAKELISQKGGLALVFRDCLDSLAKSNVVVAILDGPDVDSGTCVEIGFAFAKGKPIIGIRTDSRTSEDRGLNLMVSHACTMLILGSQRDTQTLAEKTVQAIRELTPAQS